jgi:uncharacterized protein
MKSAILVRVACIVGTMLTAANVAHGDMPMKTTWTAHDTTSSGYAQVAAIGDMLEKHYRTDMRIIPSRSGLNRMASLRSSEADYCACGIAAYFAQEGAFIFAHEDWGPQPIRLLMTNLGSFGLSLATAKDAKVRTIADLKGKRISWVQGAPALNWNVSAYLSFAGLTWNDVKKVKVSSFAASFDAIIDGRSDAAFSSTVSPSPKKLAASPRGLFWPELPHNDEAGWKRVMANAPIYNKVNATIGSAIDKNHPSQLSNYPYPLLVADASKEANEVYAIVKAMNDHYADYKDAAPGASGWRIDAQNMTWAMPYHDGAIRFWKEANLWTLEAQLHHDKLVERQRVIKEAWDGLPDKDDLDQYDLMVAWAKTRSAALRASSLDLVFK